MANDKEQRSLALLEQIPLVPRDVRAWVDVYVNPAFGDTLTRQTIQRAIVAKAPPLLSSGELAMAISVADDCDTSSINLPWVDPYPQYFAEARIRSMPARSDWADRQVYTPGHYFISLNPKPLSISAFEAFSGKLGGLEEPFRTSQMRVYGRYRVTGRDSLAEWLIANFAIKRDRRRYMNGNAVLVETIPISARMRVSVAGAMVTTGKGWFVKVLGSPPGVDIYEVVFPLSKGGYSCEPAQSALPIVSQFNPKAQRIQNRRRGFFETVSSLIRAIGGAIVDTVAGRQGEGEGAPDDSASGA
jgi:hypothetical protein